MSPASPAALAGLSVLLVDDNPHVREVLREFLRRLGASVIARPDGRSALAAVRARRFDVILLDLRLPDMDVVALAGGIRRISGAPQEPWVVGISAGVSDLEIQSALEHGLNDFMLKPVSMAGLAETIRMSPVAARIVVPVSGAVETISIEVTPEVRRAFFEETTPVLERIELFCRDNRARQAAAEAHYLANGCLMLGLDDALACCRTLERLALSDDLQSAITVVAGLRRALERAAETATSA
jgi:CheY-like chemotaxis protein